MWWQATINRSISTILFFWRPHWEIEIVSLLRLRAEIQYTMLCCTENLLFPIQHMIITVRVGGKWVNDEARGCDYCRPAKYLNWLLTLIVTKTDNFTFLVTYILVTTGMNLIGQMKILTDCGRYETRLKFWLAHFLNFTTLLKICLLTKLLFPSKRGWFSNSTSTYQRNTSISASNFQTLWLDWINIWHESIPGEGLDSTQHSTWQQPMRQWQNWQGR